MWSAGRIAVAYKGISLPGDDRTHIYSVLTMKEESSKHSLTRFKCPFLTTYIETGCGRDRWLEAPLKIQKDIRHRKYITYKELGKADIVACAAIEATAY